MSGVQLSGLISGSFDWQTVVNELVQIDSQPVTNLQTDEAANNSKLSALGQLSGDFTALQSASTALQADGLFNGVTAQSSTANSTWSSTAANGTPPGSYTIAVSTLATSASLNGSSNIAGPLSTSSTVSGLTLATLPTSTAPTAGTFTVDGKTVTVALTDSLQDVFDKISTATGGNVTGSYDPGSDKITLASGDSSEIVLGAANDTSNFLSVARLNNNTTGSVTSSSKLGSVSLSSPLISSGLSGAFSGVDSSGNGSFTVNGVSIAYNVNTDSLATVLGRINNSSAGVTASFNPTSASISLSNNSTGDTGIGINDVSGNFTSVLGMTAASGASFVHGANAVFTINGGSPITSASNNLSSAVTGVTGLTVNVNSQSSQTITVSPDTDSMSTAIQGFITAFNNMQADIAALTQVTTNVNGTVTSSILSGNQEVPQWSTDLRNLAFNSANVSGAIKSLDDIGIGFSGISPTLSVTDSTKLENALTTNPTAVGSFFQSANTGFAAEFKSYTSKILLPGTGALAIETNTLNNENASDASKITQLQIGLDAERTNLTNEFLAMQTAQSKAQSEQSILNGLSGSSSSSSSSSSATTSPTVVSS
ncbi:MAG TPA: flagellar filament capping protein FliD [Opitutaceae bacterium]|nr:flagellar filament capping protein FliD [Opitutaceae bacterium]